jgi:hypothetical protein
VGVLSGEQIEQFVSRGFVRVNDCFSRELALDLTRKACERLYCSIDDPATWPVGRPRAPETGRVECSEFSPRAWQAACELVGGEDRALRPCTWGDGFIINFGRQPEHEWHPPSATIRPYELWHKDGDFFRHFLDSPEQGLLVVALFSDIQRRGGATSIACDSVGHIARLLADNPQGLLPSELRAPASEIIGRCTDFVELTGSIGDVVFLHPYMLHSQSLNTLPVARFIINPPVKLQQPMSFDRPDGAYSPVERGTLRALGVERYAFSPSAPREAVVPERLAREKKFWAEREAAALGGLNQTPTPAK